MKRFPAYDPPEYVDWQPDAELSAEFVDTWYRDPERRSIVEQLNREPKLDLYRGLLRTRLHDITLKRWVRHGIISKAWLGTGEEAATVGPVHALNRRLDIVAPMIRNAGACCEMGMPVADMLRGYLGTYDSPSRGRDGHVGDLDRRVLQPISNIGIMPPVTVGIALGFRLRGEDGIALTWVGDGSMKHGGTHEALGLAVAQHLSVIFIIQNNQIALGTPVTVHHPPGTFESVHQAYGVAGWSFDGNNVLDAYAATKLAVRHCLSEAGPVVLAGETFRMGGHATHDEQEARELIPPELFTHWGARDPIGLYEEYLKGDGVGPHVLERIESEIVQEVEDAEREALSSREASRPAPESALEGVYASYSPSDEGSERVP
ncbi:MAG: thiamine pyrophosphate-dependent dehydrogenase E1 component subunit alpha [Gemmatimonadota bacterium]|nr:MAG: thiamine pyrophosphate-dependent dehydrogenase E1 component subunit alpha [Gemmatimonadota bacterium]